MNPRILVTAIGFALAGAILGYAINAAGPLPALATVVFLVLLMRRSRGYPEQGGAFLVGLGIVGGGLLALVIARCPAPSCHFEALTPVTLVCFVLLAALGVWMLIRATRQGRFESEP